MQGCRSDHMNHKHIVPSTGYQCLFIYTILRELKCVLKYECSSDHINHNTDWLPVCVRASGAIRMCRTCMVFIVDTKKSDGFPHGRSQFEKIAFASSSVVFTKTTDIV